jgi:C-terminal processing protease CtpA/Prc
MSLQTAENAVTIGSQTAGADGNTVPFVFLGEYQTLITGLGIYYPDRTPAQRKGVKVDIEVKPTIQGIREGRDEVLERALKYIEENR